MAISIKKMAISMTIVSFVILFAMIGSYLKSKLDILFPDVEVKQEIEQKVIQGEGYTVGQALEGRSFQEMYEAYMTERDKSSIKGIEYLKSLIGEKVVWVGKVVDVSYYANGKGAYMRIEIWERFLSHYLYTDITGSEELMNMNEGLLVVIKGTIESFGKIGSTEPTLSPDIKHTSIEVL
jgi:hypothetical protein